MSGAYFMKILSLFIAFNMAFSIFLYNSNKRIGITQRTLHMNHLPDGFDGYTIAHVSDYHNSFFGFRATHVLRKIRALKAEVIFFTGDIIDRRTPNLKRAKRFIDDLSDIAPVYYVTGNHEIHYDDFNALYNYIGASKWQNISMNGRVLERYGDSITLLGMNDLWFYGDEESLEIFEHFRNALNRKVDGVTGFKMLLSHRPELMQMYVDAGVNVVFSGHAHGGQFRLPIIKGLYAPHQGINPKYSEGVHTIHDTTLHISRGLGNSRFPFRLFNHPEVIKVTLRKK